MSELMQTSDFVNAIQQIRRKRKKYRYPTREAAEAAERKNADEVWMLNAALDDVLSGWIGTDRGGNPVRFKGHWHTIVAMRPESASGGFILSIRHHGDENKNGPRKHAEAVPPDVAKRWLDNLRRGYNCDSPDAKETNELIDLLGKAINALPYA